MSDGGFENFSKLDCELVTDFSRLEELSPAWQRWAAANATIFQRWEWARAYWKTYGNHLSLCSVVVHRKGAPLGILPLVRRDQSVEFLGSRESDYNDLLYEEGCAAEVLEAALDFLRKRPFPWTSGFLDNIPSSSAIVRNIARLPWRIRRHLQLVFRCPTPTIVVDPGGADVLHKLMNKDQLKRSVKKLEKIGTLRFRHFDNRKEAREHLSRFFDQHVTRWAMNGIPSLFLEADRREFYHSLIDEFDLREQLRFGVPELNSQPIAYHFGFQLNGTMTWYKPTFDVKYWDLSPGDALIRNLFQYAHDAGMKEFDFTIGSEPFKYRYSNLVRRNYSLYLEAHPAHLTNQPKRLVRYAVHAVRKQPALKSVIKTSVGYAKSAMSRMRRLANTDLLTSCTQVRMMIWMRDEVLFFSSAAGVAEVAGVEISPAGLDALARLAMKYPEIFDDARFREIRLRLKRGDKVFLARDHNDAVCVLWVGMFQEIALPNLSPEWNIPLGAPAPVLYDVWLSPGFGVKEVLADVLCALAKQSQHAEFWIYCSRRQTALRGAIEEAGFRLRHRLLHRSFLRGLRRSHILLPGELATPGSLAVKTAALSDTASLTEPAPEPLRCGSRVEVEN